MAGLAAEIDSELRSLGTGRRVERNDEAHFTAAEQLGVRAADTHAIVRALARRVSDAPAAAVVALAEALLDGGTHEGRLVAYSLLAHHRPAAASLKTRAVERLGRGLDNWASVDSFCATVAGPGWRERRVTDTAVERWVRSSDRWWRRVAVVSTVALNGKSWGGTGDTPRTLHICELVIADRDDVVEKALSWALRILSQHDRAATEAFLARHGDALAARVRREVRHKLVTGLKHPRRARTER